MPDRTAPPGTAEVRAYWNQALVASSCGGGERLPFPDDSFDFVYAHGVVQYAAGDRALVDECRRVLRPGGTAFSQLCNRVSWLNALCRVMKVGLEHEDAPVIRKYSPGEFRGVLGGFSSVRVVYERFPVRSRLRGRWKGALYNQLFVGACNAIPKALVRRSGWHLLAFCQK
jgi:SAM-dependent methyltransferase